jgi:hypothetical protein
MWTARGRRRSGRRAAISPAARDLRRHRSLIAVAAWGSLLHVANHAVDHLAEGATLAHWLADMGPLALGVVLLGAVLLPARANAGTREGVPAGDAPQ